MKNCICNGMRSMGDAASCMWVCPQHGITSTVEIWLVLDNFIKQHKLSKQDVLYSAYGFLQSMYIKHKLIDKIYFDEDKFYDDLKQHLASLLPK